MTHPAQHPPQTRGVAAAACIVGHDLRAIVDAEGAEPQGERDGMGQRMPSVPAVLRSGEVFVKVQEARARDVGLRVGLPPGLVVQQVVAAIAHDPGRIIEMQGELVYADERCEVHPNPFTAKDTRDAKVMQVRRLAKPGNKKGQR